MRKAAFVLGLLLVCAPVRAQSPDPDSDEAGLAMQVARIEDTVKTSSLLIRDEGLNRYVRDVACRLAAKDCPSLRIYIVETPGEDATALPNGALVIWSGTLLRMENESQLAHLLGHEIAHYLHKDSVSQFHRMLGSNGLVAILGVAASGVGMGIMGTPASMAALSVRYAHSESEEEHADQTGFGLATDAGYDPQAVGSLWRNADPYYLRRHPATDVRLAALQGLTAQIPARAVWNAGAEAYQAEVAPFLERWVNEELRDSADNVALFMRLSASGRGIFRYGLGEAYRKRGRPGDDVLATQAFRAALAAPDPQPLAWRGLGLVAMQQGDKAAARFAFGKYRAALPLADDRAMTDYYLSQP